MSQQTSLGERDKIVPFRLVRRSSIKGVRARKIARFLPVLAMPLLVCLWLGGWLFYLIGERKKLRY